MTLLEAGDADALGELVDDCAALGICRRLLLVRLPRPIAGPFRSSVRRLVMDRLAPFAAADRMRLFRLAEEDFAVSWRDGGLRDRAVDDAVGELRVLLAGLTETTGEAARCGGGLLLCQLPADAEAARCFLDESSVLLATPPVWQASGSALDLRELAAIERALVHADVARFVRRRRIWDLGGATPSVRWEHRQLDLADLAATLSPGHDLAAEPWLCRRLGRTLDRRLLALLADPTETRSAAPFMLDLAVASILDPAFRRFDETLPHALRGHTAVRLSPIDLVDDAASFGVARDVAKARGHCTVLAACDPAALAGFAWPRTGIDYAELAWHALQGGDADPAWPAAGLILTDVPDARALARARKRGFRLFTGPAVERLT